MSDDYGQHLIQILKNHSLLPLKLDDAVVIIPRLLLVTNTLKIYRKITRLLIIHDKSFI